MRQLGVLRLLYQFSCKNLGNSEELDGPTRTFHPVSFVMSSLRFATKPGIISVLCFTFCSIPDSLIALATISAVSPPLRALERAAALRTPRPSLSITNK